MLFILNCSSQKKNPVARPVKPTRKGVEAIRFEVGEVEKLVVAQVTIFITIMSHTHAQVTISITTMSHAQVAIFITTLSQVIKVKILTKNLNVITARDLAILKDIAD